MMHMFRKAAVFIMFAILIVAFAVSMGGNNYFDRYTHPTIAKVGSMEITPQLYQRTYERALENFSARAGQRISAQQAKAMGFPERVLRELIQETAIDYEASKLRLGLSQTGLRQSLMSNSYFLDKQGKFSPEKYQHFLQTIGYTAPAFEQEYRGDLIRRQIQGIFKDSGVVPAVLMEAFNRYINEQRTVAFFSLEDSAAGAIEAPAEEALKSYYEEHKAAFMAPELRKVAVVTVAPEPAPDKASVSDEEVKAEYDAHGANYGAPERRNIEIIPFQTKQAADAAYTGLKANGGNFAEAAKSAGFKEGDISLGMVSKKELSAKLATNEAILKTAFELKKGEFSAPVDGPLSWVIIKVLDIEPGKEKNFDEVKDQIRADLEKAKIAAEAAKQAKAFEQRRDKLVKSIEEERATGLPLRDIAKKLNLPLEEVSLDRAGNGSGGNAAKLAAVPAPQLAAAAFKSEPGVENEALRLSNGGYAWFDVEDVIKAHQKPFEEVKADVESAWRRDQLKIKIAQKARDLVARIEKGEPIADIAKSVGATVKNSEPIKREGSAPDLPAAAISQAFSLGEGGASSVQSGGGAARVVFQVTKVIAPAPLDAAGTKSMEQRLSAQIAEDSFAEFVSGIEKSAGVTVDHKTFTAVAGGAYESEE
jgi:peptidyl-prolyl cis-trans isomerase D